MIHLNLTLQERSTLMQALDSYLSELRVEIANTENFNYREELKTEERTLAKILVTLQEAREVEFA